MDKRLHDMIADAYRSDPARASLDKVAAHLSATDVKALPLWQQAHTMSFLKETVLRLAEDEGHVHADTASVDTRHFEGAMRQLLRLTDATAYDGGLGRWLDGQRRDFAATVSRFPDFNAAMAGWGTYSDDDKMAFAQTFTERMNRFYMRDLPEMEIPAVRKTSPGDNQGSAIQGKNSPPLTGTFNFLYSTATGLNAPGNSFISIPERILQKENFFYFVQILVHENTHAVSYNLGNLQAQGLLDTRHPAYSDAEKRITLNFNETSIKRIEIAELYDISSEEDLAFHNETEFFRDIRRSRPGMYVDTALYDAKEMLDKLAVRLSPIINVLPKL